MISGALLPLLLLLQGSYDGTPPPALSLPAGTPVWVKSDTPVPQRIGQPVRAHLLYGIFANNQLVLPAGTPVQGSVVGLNADHSHRVQARLRGDFTPFSKAVVQFDSVTLNGRTIKLPLGRAQDGAPVLQLTPPPPSKGGFIRREYDQGVVMVKDRVRLITAPGKEDRLKELLYSQLPYHPQRIATGTVWTADTDAQLALGPAFEKGATPQPVPCLPPPPKPPKRTGRRPGQCRPTWQRRSARRTPRSVGRSRPLSRNR